MIWLVYCQQVNAESAHRSWHRYVLESMLSADAPNQLEQETVGITRVDPEMSLECACGLC